MANSVGATSVGANSGFSQEVQLDTSTAIARLPVHLFSKCPFVFLKLSSLIVLPPTLFLLWTTWEAEILTNPMAVASGWSSTWAMRHMALSTGSLVLGGLAYGLTVAAARIAMIVVVAELYLDRSPEEINWETCLWRGFKRVPSLVKSSALFVLYSGSFFLAMMMVLVVIWVIAALVYRFLAIDLTLFFLLFRFMAYLNVYVGFLGVFFCTMVLSGQPLLIVERCNVFEGLYLMWLLTKDQWENVSFAFLFHYIKVQLSVACYFGVVFGFVHFGWSSSSVALVLLCLPFFFTVPLLSIGTTVVYLALRIEKVGGFNRTVLERDMQRFDDGQQQEWRAPDTENGGASTEPFLVAADRIG